MKICPKCQNKYTDRTLKFCLQDGTELIGGVEKLDSNQTDSFEETETIISNKRPNQISFDLSKSQEPNQNQSQVTKVSGYKNEPKKSKTLIAVLFTVLIMLFIFGFAGIGAYFYYINDKTEILENDSSSNDRNENLENKNSRAESEKTPMSDKTKKPTPKKTFESTPPPYEDPEQTKKDVENTIYGWKSMAESRNLNGYMNNYASRVDYYRKKNASKSFVQNDKQKAFSKYDSIKSTISNMNVKPDINGRNAVATFDKEWDFSGQDANTSGKVRTQLKLKKIGDSWLITSEKDLKIYYVNK